MYTSVITDHDYVLKNCTTAVFTYRHTNVYGSVARRGINYVVAARWADRSLFVIQIGCSISRMA